jgi:hypothetical protein
MRPAAVDRMDAHCPGWSNVYYTNNKQTIFKDVNQLMSSNVDRGEGCEKRREAMSSLMVFLARRLKAADAVRSVRLSSSYLWYLDSMNTTRRKATLNNGTGH